MDRRYLPIALGVALGIASPSRPGGAAVAEGDWPPERRREILESTLTVRLAPDLTALGPGERAALVELLAAGEVLQRIYEQSLHPEAAAARERLAGLGDEGRELRTLFRLFQGPIATTLDNRREPFLAAAPEQPGKNVYPWEIAREEIEAFLAARPDRREEILGERTVVRRATAESVSRDRAALDRHPELEALHPGFGDRLRELAAARDPEALYAVPFALAWADELGAVQRRLFSAAARVEAEDPELARYLRNRGRDLLSNDYESGDASWVTGRFGNLNAQIGAYETYDDALYGVKAFHSLSLVVRDLAATEELRRSLGGLQAVEDALPYEPKKRVREEISVGVYSVVADFGQARGTNTATILPNDPLFTRRYGRTILMRANILRHPELLEIAERRWRAAVAPAHAGELGREGGFQRTLWHEVGHYLGVERTRDGRPLDQALQEWADALEEMKSDLVALFTAHRFHATGLLDDARLADIRAAGILRTLQDVRPRPDQPYQTMQLAQLNGFLERGLLALDAEGRLVIRHERYAETVRAMLAEVLELQAAGDPAAAEAFFSRWTEWRDDLHEPLARRLAAAAGPRFRLVLYEALGD